jgi:predicted RNA-binding protein (virulence factor B family)
VQGEAWRFDPEIGLFVILERRALGLLPAAEPHRLRRGQSASFRVAHVHRDGKVELSLRGLGHEEQADDAALILERMRKSRAVRVSDRTSPEELRALFGLSKKAFKRAMGKLLKERRVRFDDDGCYVLGE